ncbi:MAG: lamin tail domain-containing protein [Myxococcota bacterium]|nr:lamin tail domain-containing protein [Myxococcota bacterium]
MPPLMLMLALGCTDYEVSTIRRREPTNWFDEQSDDYRSGLDPEAADTGDAVDTGAWIDDDDDGGDEAGDEPWSDAEEDAGGDDEGNGEETTPPDDPVGEPAPDAPSGGHSDSGVSSGSGAFSARMPWVGDLVITELMIHPQSSDDAEGEWVELRNMTSDWLDISGHRLSDRGVDNVAIEAVGEGSLVVAPGGFAVICADGDYWTNGGVECSGTFRYWTLGGGFALSNGADEVQLRTPFGTLLDEVRYGEDFDEEGEAMGLKTEMTSVVGNDHASNWCAQDSFMAFGDGGTPGELNDPCW